MKKHSSINIIFAILRERVFKLFDNDIENFIQAYNNLIILIITIFIRLRFNS